MLIGPIFCAGGAWGWLLRSYSNCFSGHLFPMKVVTHSGEWDSAGSRNNFLMPTIPIGLRNCRKFGSVSLTSIYFSQGNVIWPSNLYGERNFSVNNVVVFNKEMTCSIFFLLMIKLLVFFMFNKFHWTTDWIDLFHYLDI